VQIKVTRNVLNKIIADNFPSLEKEMSTQQQGASSIPNQQEQNRISPQQIIIKTLSTREQGKNIESCKEEGPSQL
jgi:hypothetical protein